MDKLNKLREIYTSKKQEYDKLGLELKMIEKEIKDNQLTINLEKNDSPKWMDKYLASHW